MKKIIIYFIAFIFYFSCGKSYKKDHLPISLNFTKANAFFERNIYDSAYYYYNKITYLNDDTLLVGKALFNMAIIQSIQGDYFGSTETSIRCIDYFNKADKSYLATIFNTIGINKNDLREYDQAIEWYQKAIPIAVNLKEKLMFQNNLAVAFNKVKKYDQAKEIYSELLKNDTILADSNLLSKVIDNTGYTKWLQNFEYNARPELLRALSIRKSKNDLWGQNASYAHLSEYYETKHPDTALMYAKKMYQVAKAIESPDDILQALQKLIRLSPNLEVKKYFNVYQTLDDSLQNARRIAKNQFALIRYDTEKKAADNLILQKDVSAKRYQLIIIISVSILLFGYGILWYRKRRQRLALEAEQAIRESQLKTSKRVHDVVANGLYRVMSEMENQPEIDKEAMLDRIEDLYEKSRDISYEDPGLGEEPFHEKIAELLRSFAADHRHVAIVGNSAAMWSGIPAKTCFEIEHVLQELMVNMKRHSQADNVVVRFENTGKVFHIFYTDNGIGFPGEMKMNNGLRNTGNRISSIGGALNFDAGTERGVKIHISFPVT